VLPKVHHWRDLNVPDLALLIHTCKLFQKDYVRQNFTLHLKLNGIDQNNQFLHSWPVKKLLSRGPNFGLMADPTALKHNLSFDVKLFEYRIAKTLDRFNRAADIEKAKEHSSNLGILEWKPCKIPYDSDFYVKESRNIYRCDCHKSHSCPELQHEVACLKSSIMSSCDRVVDLVSKAKSFFKWGNISPPERIALRKLKSMNLCYGLADKNLGPVLSSQDLNFRQIELHIRDQAGTYEEITGVSKRQLIDVGIDKLERLKISCPKFKSLLERFIVFARWCADKEKLCKVFILWKLHKKPKDNGMESRLIAPNINYFTADASTFLHFQLAPFVFAHEFVLQDSLTLCRLIEVINQEEHEWYETRIATADVVALYPSIDIKSGLIALRWFLSNFTQFSEDLQFFIFHLAEFVLNNNYVEVDGLGSGIFKQVVGVAMGTSFSVMFAIIFMIWIETPIIEKYRKWILLFKRAIDDQIFLWQGPERVFNQLKTDFDSAHQNIKFDWGVLGKSAVFLDLNLNFAKAEGRYLFIESSVYCKPGNAFCYLQPDSYHPRHNFRGWIRGLLIRNITRANTVEAWRSENKNLFYRLRARGHKRDFLLKLFEEIHWSDRSKYLIPRVKEPNRTNFIPLTTQYVPGFDIIKKVEPLSFASFRNTSYAISIFPADGTWVAKSAPKLGNILGKRHS
jgi:hypothetical protein